MSTSPFIKETVGCVAASLKMLARLLAVDEKLVPLIGTLSDFGSCFPTLSSLVPLMQARIKQDAFSALKLRATFLKPTSLLDLQLVRILQAELNDAASVSEHYSTTIVDFVRIVLEHYFVKKKILSWQSEYQSKIALIELPPRAGPLLTCLGPLMSGLVEMTRHEASTYCAIMGGWLNLTTGEEIIGTKSVKRIGTRDVLKERGLRSRIGNRRR
jgi:hypothetical protein